MVFLFTKLFRNIVLLVVAFNLVSSTYFLFYFFLIKDWLLPSLEKLQYSSQGL